MILYHGSDADFEIFSDKFLVREGSGPNSALGIWLGERWVAGNFGKYTYKVKCSCINLYRMPIGEMIEHHSESEGDPAYFVKMRIDMMSQGYDGILVLENDGTTPTGVVMDLSKLAIVGRETR